MMPIQAEGLIRCLHILFDYVIELLLFKKKKNTQTEFPDRETLSKIS